MLEGIPLIHLIGAGVVGVVLWMSILIRPEMGRLALAGTLFLSSIGVALTWNGLIYGSWLLPLQGRRAPALLALCVVLLIGMAMHAHRFDASRLSRQAIVLFMIGAYQGLLRMYHDSFFDGVASIFFAVLTIGGVALAASMLLRRWSDWPAMVRAIGYAGLVYFGAVAVQIVLNRSKISIGNDDRFIGVSSNPQIAAALCAVFTVTATWLYYNDPLRRLRLIWVALAGFAAIGVVGSGSRTGLAMIFIGLTGIMYRRFGRRILLLPVAALSVYLIYKLTLLLGLDLGFERILSTKDTRSAVWLFMLDTFRENWIFGTGATDAEGSENSFLFGAASFGIGMVFLMGLLVIVSLVHCLRLFRAGLRHREFSPVVDLILSFNAMYFAGALFEGYLIARTSAMLVFMLLFSAMSSALLAAIAARDPEVLAPEYDDEDWDDEYDEAWEDDPDPAPGLDYAGA